MRWKGVITPCGGCFSPRLANLAALSFPTMFRVGGKRRGRNDVMVGVRGREMLVGWAMCHALGILMYVLFVGCGYGGIDDANG